MNIAIINVQCVYSSNTTIFIGRIHSMQKILYILPMYIVMSDQYTHCTLVISQNTAGMTNLMIMNMAVYYIPTYAQISSVYQFILNHSDMFRCQYTIFRGFTVVCS